MSPRGFFFPVFAVSLPSTLGDGFTTLARPSDADAPPFAPSERVWLEPRVGLTIADMAAESSWQAKNSKFWPAPSLCAPLDEVKLPSGYATPYDHLSIDEILAQFPQRSTLDEEWSLRWQFNDRQLYRVPPPSPEGLGEKEVNEWVSKVGTSGAPSEEFVRQALEQARANPAAELELVMALVHSRPVLSLWTFGWCVRALVRFGNTELAEVLLEDASDPDLLILAADLARAREEPAEAQTKVGEALAQNARVLGGVERAARWRAAVLGDKAPRPTIRVVLDGVHWVISFRAEPVLGRVDADLIAPAPVVSRKHLVFYEEDGVAFVADAKSTHGTFIGPSKMRAPTAIREPLELRLGGSVPCLIRPAHPSEGSGVVVSVSGAHYLLAFKSAASIGSWRLVRAGGKLQVSHAGDASEGGPSFAEPGATFTSKKGSRLHVEPASFYARGPSDTD